MGTCPSMFNSLFQVRTAFPQKLIFQEITFYDQNVLISTRFRFCLNAHACKNQQTLFCHNELLIACDCSVLLLQLHVHEM